MYDPPLDKTESVASGTFTVPYVLPANAGVTPVYRGPVYNWNQPHLLTYNLTAERQLPGSMAPTVAYAGSRGINLNEDHEGSPEAPNGIPSNGICVARTFTGTCPVVVGSPNATLGNCRPTTALSVNPTSAAGTITATNGTARQIRFGLKVLF
jgi:hypothetical protein